MIRYYLGTLGRGHSSLALEL